VPGAMPAEPPDSPYCDRPWSTHGCRCRPTEKGQQLPLAGAMANVHLCLGRLEEL